jgi:hypothetical protein
MTVLQNDQPVYNVMYVICMNETSESVEQHIILGSLHPAPLSIFHVLPYSPIMNMDGDLMKY